MVATHRRSSVLGTTRLLLLASMLIINFSAIEAKKSKSKKKSSSKSKFGGSSAIGSISNLAGAIIGNNIPVTTPAPTPSPTSMPTSCVECSNFVTPWMFENDKECETWEYTRGRCKNKVDYWLEHKFCQVTCSNLGYPYDGIPCCASSRPTKQPSPEPSAEPSAMHSAEPSAEPSATLSKEPSAVPSPSPSEKLSSEPTNVIGPDEKTDIIDPDNSCTECTDIGPRNMIDQGYECSTWAKTEQRCGDERWKNRNFCQFTCFTKGLGYEGDNCCDKAVDVVPDGTPAAPPTPRQELEAAKVLWASRIAGNSYEFQTQRTCFCTEQYTKPMIVTVHDGTVVSAIYSNDGKAVHSDVASRILTIEQQFDLIKTAINTRAHSVYVKYNESYGFPTDVEIDQYDIVSDEEVYIENRDVILITPPEEPSAPPSEMPSKAPSPSPNDDTNRDGCQICTNDPTPWMNDNNKDCDTWYIGHKCVNDAAEYWPQAKFCQQSCFEFGLGYPGDNCCSLDNHVSAEMSTDAPTPAPSSAVDPESCIVCDNEPSPWMKDNQKTCAFTWYLGYKCESDVYGYWQEEKFCRQSCFDSGNGYAGDPRCCGEEDLVSDADLSTADDSNLFDDYGAMNTQCFTLTAECGPNNPCQNGACCSQWGWCGFDDAWCDECCQSNCDNSRLLRGTRSQTAAFDNATFIYG